MRSITRTAFVIGAPAMSSGFFCFTGSALSRALSLFPPSFAASLFFFCISRCNAMRSWSSM